MKVKDLIKKLNKLDPKGDLKVMIKERGCSNVHDIDDVNAGWYLDDGFDAPDFIDEHENPEDYGVNKNEPKIVCLE